MAIFGPSSYRKWPWATLPLGYRNCRQQWGIAPKIAEVDRSLTQGVGDNIRLRVLEGFGIDVSALSIDDLSDARAKADITDALDALVGLAVSTGAQRVSAGGATTTDGNGPTIEIWY